MSSDGLIPDISVLERRVKGSHRRLDPDAFDSCLSLKDTPEKENRLALSFTELMRSNHLDSTGFRIH